jgi:hypothetical protein
MSRLLKSAVAALAVVPVVAFAAPVSATVQSSIEGGDIYRVKNVTKNVDFTDPANADACNVLEYKVRLHNGGPTEVLNNVTVSAAFQTAASTKNVSLITARADNASPSNTSDSATVNLSSAQTMSYVNGSTQLLDANGNVIKALPDTITTSGVNIGSLGISLNEKRYVQFQEKVNCPTPTPTPTPKPTPTPTPTPAPTTTPTATPAPQAPVSLPNTGAGDVLGAFAGASAAGTAAHAAVRRLRRNK